jgi:hypothetical protein
VDGSTASLIAIPIVATLALAAWLLLIVNAAAHPQWKKHATLTAGAGDAAAAHGHVHPADLALTDADQHVIPEEPAKLAA